MIASSVGIGHLLDAALEILDLRRIAVGSRGLLFRHLEAATPSQLAILNRLAETGDGLLGRRQE
jgi:hypothetical protein